MTPEELKELFTKRDEAWGDFMRTNNERLDALEKGLPTTDLDAKLSAINVDMAEMKKSFDDIEIKANRPALGGEVQLTQEQEDHKKAFNVFLRKGNDEGLAALQAKAMQSGSDPDGGYLVLPEMDMAIDRVAETISAMYRLADVSTIGGPKWEKMVKISGLAMRRIADGSGGGESQTPRYQKVVVEAHTAEVEPWVFNETLEDSFIDLANDLAEEAAIGFGEGGGAEFINGDGVGGARGITAYPTVVNSSYEWGKVGHVISGASGAFASSNPGDKIISLQHALKQQYRPGAAFLCADSTLALIRQIKDSSGAYYLWNPDASAGFGGRILGSPVEIDDNMPAVGAGSLSLAFGNFKRGYKVVNRAGTVLIRDNLTSKGQTKFNFRRRFGAGIKNFEAIKLMKFSN